MDRIRRFDQIGVDDIESAGGKGANLGELSRSGIPVPPGFVITTAAYTDFVHHSGIDARIVELARTAADDDLAAADAASAAISGLFQQATVPDDVATEITTGYEQLGSVAVAVRSSATAEDLQDASFAGQQDTYLNITGRDAVLAAVKDCWASLWTPRAITYRRRAGISPDQVSTAVVVQQLVDADAAGVMFTANPTNGRRDQTVIAAAWGLGESVVGGTVTTDNLVVDRTDSRTTLRTNEIADKQVQTVRTPSGTEEVPVPAHRRTAPVLDEQAALALAELGERISAHYDRPMDVEWARSDGAFSIVQARPITALPDPVGDAPTEWPVPKPRAMYFRASIVEQMPDPLTPLFADLIGPAVQQSVLKIFSTLVGSEAMAEEAVEFPTVNGYAYYEYSPTGLLKFTMKAAPLIPGMLSGAKADYVTRWETEEAPRYRTTVERCSATPSPELSATDLLDVTVELLEAGCEYYTCVQTIIPLAASTESIFTKLYEPIRRRRGGPSASTFVLGYDSEPIRADRALYELAQWCKEQPELATALSDGHPVDALAFGGTPDGVPATTWDEWRSRIDAYLGQYGHATYNLDFASPVAADDPEPVLEALRFYLGDDAPDPRVRTARLAKERERATEQLLSGLDPVRRRLIATMLRRAQRYAPVREDALAQVGLAWPTMRALLRELGSRLVAAGALAERDDVFWLTECEARDLAGRLDRGETGLTGPGARIAQRRMVWRGRRTVIPPGVLPQGTFAKLIQPWMPSVEATDADGPVLTGLGASGGRAGGEAALVTEPAEFGRMQPRRVLVAKITTPAYTPLFAMASAVVTDVGGPLSHSSIVAREYGIPAVLGTGNATQRITNRQHITVDGNAGRVLLDPTAEDAIAGTARISAGAIAGLAAAGSAIAAGTWWLIRRRRTRT